MVSENAMNASLSAESAEEFAPLNAQIEKTQAALEGSGSVWAFVDPTGGAPGAGPPMKRILWIGIGSPIPPPPTPPISCHRAMAGSGIGSPGVGVGAGGTGVPVGIAVGSRVSWTVAAVVGVAGKAVGRADKAVGVDRAVWIKVDVGA